MAGTVAGALRSAAVSLAVIEPTIIIGVESSDSLIDFYERAYSSGGTRAALYAGWRT